MSSGIRSELAKAVVDTLDDAVIVTDATGRIESWNAAAERLFGWSRSEMCGRDVASVMAEFDLPGSLSDGGPARSHGVQELEGRHRDGSRFPIELSVVRTEIEGQTRFAGVVRDLSERRAADALFAMRGRVAGAVNQILRGFIKATLWSRRGLFDEALENLLGLTGSEFGFIGEVLETDEGLPYLRAYAITDLSWNSETRTRYRDEIRQGLTFRNLHNLFGVTVRTGELVIANDPATDPRSGGLPPGHPDLDAFMGLPIHAGGRFVGMIGVANRPGGYDEAVAETLAPFLAALGTVIAGFQNLQTRRRAEQDLYRAQQRLRILATQDGLTETPNRHSLMDAMEDAFARSEGLAIPFSVVFVDVDHFKRINDAHGHEAGDRVLRHLARILRETIRPSDIIGRYGGEEFVLAFLECEEPYALMVAERLRSRIEGEPFPIDEDGCKTIPITISAGVASWHRSATSAADLVDWAEQAVSEAKQTGRNRICTHRRKQATG